MINPNEVSVIVQGPVLGEPWWTRDRRLTFRALRRVREVLPGARVILSTWTGTNVTDLDFDELVLSEDPGALPLNLEGGKVTAWNNVNRQIVSTVAGLRAAKTKYALKIRSDLYLDDARFLAQFGRFTARDAEFSFVKERVLVSAFHSRLGPNRTAYHPCLFHPNDWFYFGLTGDVLDVWDVPLMSEEDARWFERRPKPRDARDVEGHVSRWVAECWLWSSFVRKHRPIAFESYLDSAPALSAQSERSIAGNLVLLDPDQLRMTSLKYPHYVWLKGWGNFKGRWSHRIWAEVYRAHADATHALPRAPTWGYLARLVRGGMAHARRTLVRAVRALAKASLPLAEA